MTDADYFTLAAQQARTAAQTRQAEAETGLPLFRSHPRHHANDPATSVEAGILAAPRAEQIRARVLARLRVSPHGLTAEQIDAAEGWHHLDAARRLTELLADGLVTRGPDTRPTSRGRAASVWRVV